MGESHAGRARTRLGFGFGFGEPGAIMTAERSLIYWFVSTGMIELGRVRGWARGERG